MYNLTLICINKLKTSLAILLILISPLTGWSQIQTALNKHKNYLDSIDNPKQIEKLLVSIDERYKNFKVNDIVKYTKNNCQKFSDSLGIESYSKADFDNNGLTDLLVVGNYYSSPGILCILDNGKNYYEIQVLTKMTFQDCAFAKVNRQGIAAGIDYYSEQQPEKDKLFKPGTFKKSSLIYKFGSFVEQNDNVHIHSIEKIEYETTGCYGSCPVFAISIEKNGNVIFEAQRYNTIYDITGKK